MTGRPKCFDNTSVLEAAMQLIWKQGYGSTCYEELVAATEVGRQSLYHSFGNKSSLYQKSLEHYSQTVTQVSLDLLNKEGSPISNIYSWLKRLKEKSTQHRNGCLLTNTSIELAPHHARFRKHVASESRRIEMQEGIKDINAGGLNVVAISYDSQEVLQKFAKSSEIEFPLLSDPGIKDIELFGLLNTGGKKGTRHDGISHPLTVLIDSDRNLVDDIDRPPEISEGDLH